MTKKLFLAAASVAALTFAGAAQAGDLSGTFGGGAFSDTAPYLVASELVVSATDKAEGTLTANLALDTPIAVGPTAQRDHLVTFTVTGAQLATPALTFDTSTGTNSNVTSSLVSTTNGVMTFLVTVSDDTTVSEITLTGVVSQSAKADIKIAADVVAVIGATNIPVDSASAITAATYSPVVGAFTATPDSAVAALPDFIEFDDGLGGTTLTAELASDIKLAESTAPVHSDLDGTVVTLGDVVASATVTISGPDFGSLTPSLDGGIYDAAASTATSAVFDVADVTDLDGTAAFEVAQTATVADQEEINAGSYSAVIGLTYEAGFAGAATKPAVAVGSISLDGVNFVAPWVSGTGMATSVVRLGNNSSQESGPVTVRLMNAVTVSGGVATPFVSAAAPLELGGVPAGGDLQITSADLVSHFGAFTRGDIQITVQSDSTALSAKMRSTRNGQTFEQSLGAISAGVVQ